MVSWCIGTHFPQLVSAARRWGARLIAIMAIDMSFTTTVAVTMAMAGCRWQEASGRVGIIVTPCCRPTIADESHDAILSLIRMTTNAATTLLRRSPQSASSPLTPPQATTTRNTSPRPIPRLLLCSTSLVFSMSSCGGMRRSTHPRVNARSKTHQPPDMRYRFQPRDRSDGANLPRPNALRGAEPDPFRSDQNPNAGVDVVLFFCRRHKKR